MFCVRAVAVFVFSEITLWLLVDSVWTYSSNQQDADKKGLSTIAEDVKTLAQKAKENSLKPEDYEVEQWTMLIV